MRPELRVIIFTTGDFLGFNQVLRSGQPVNFYKVQTFVMFVLSSYFAFINIFCSYNKLTKISDKPVCHETSAMMHYIRPFNVKYLPQLEQFSFWPNNPSRPWAASGLKFLYTDPHRPCKTSLHERSASRSDRSLHDTKQTQTHEHLCPQRFSNPRSQTIRWLQNYESVRSAIGSGIDCWRHRTVCYGFELVVSWLTVHRNVCEFYCKVFGTKHVFITIMK